jgi:hypothetical protein
MSRRRAPLLVLGALAALLSAACPVTPPEPTTSRPTILVPSATWRASVTASAFEERVRALTAAVDRLRTETRTGWIGRQDDQTGFLAELTGGSYAGDGRDPARGLLESYALDLFGVPADQLDIQTGLGTADVLQQVDGVPVAAGRLVASLSGEPAKVRVVRGRVFPGLDVDTEPRVRAATARRIAGRESRGTVDAVELVVLPSPAPGVLAWDVLVTGARDPRAGGVLQTRYLVDALSGALLDVIPASGEAGAMVMGRSSALGPLAQQSSPGEPVDVSGNGPLGQPLTAKGTRLPDGTVQLVDATVPWFDAATSNGAVMIHDADLTDQDPAPIATFASAQIDDADAIAAASFGRYVLDYYRDAHGRDSWDGAGGTLHLTVHVNVRCNAMFGSEGIFGDASLCPLVRTFMDIDVVAHEITHGVTSTTADLEYRDQSGALNESFSDYFGSVIGNRFRGADDDTVGQDLCVDVTVVSGLCWPHPNGLKGTRYMPNGSTFAQFVSYMDTPLSLPLSEPDNGGVHRNSSIWNNALWAIRGRLAQMDAVPALQSARAAAFDTAVYRALTGILTETSGFLEARRALEQAERDLGLDPVILQVTGEVMDQVLICEDCVLPRESPALAIGRGIASQVAPTVAGDRVSWLERADAVVGRPATSIGAAPGAPVDTGAPAAAVGLAGPDRLVVAEYGQQPRMVSVPVAGGAPQDLGPIAPEAAWPGIAGSAEGAAWVDPVAGTISFVTPSGEATSTPAPVRGATSVATGGGAVAVGLDDGVAVWRPGSEPRVIPVDGTVTGVGVHGDRLITVAGNPSETTEFFAMTVTLHDLAGGTSQVLSQQAAGFGAALSDRYAIWTQTTGDIRGPIADLYRLSDDAVKDTSLFLYSFATGTTYDLLPGVDGQQGYPALSGERVAWQDAVTATDDVYTGLLPAGL